MKKVVFINQDSGYLMIDIVNAHVEAGYSCVLITGRLVTRNNPLHDTVLVEKIIEYKRTTKLRRLISWIIGSIQIWVKVTVKYNKDSLFIVSNPPSATLLPLFVRNAFRLLIFDIYPDVLTELDYLTDRALLTRFWKALNRKVYDRALKVFTITEGMGIVLEKYVGKDAIEIIPLWTDNSFLKPVKPQDNFFIEEQHLSGKFVVLYSGNIGLATKIDSLIDIANEIGREDVVFLIIGEGSKKTLISERIKELSLKNVILLPWQHYTNLPYSLSSASLAVISLGSGNSQLFVPSKLYNFLSVGAPLLCISSAGSEIERMAEKYQCGRNFEPNDLRGMILFINDLADNPEMHLRMKENSLKASKEFSDDNAKRYLSGI